MQIQALISLAQQEWGLHGVKFSEVLVGWLLTLT